MPGTSPKGCGWAAFPSSGAVVLPLILTLALDPASQGFFERERQRWFPPSLNMIPAHVTLFHHLPGDGLPRLCADLQTCCADEAPAPFSVDRPLLLGRGVAYAIGAPAAAAFRARLVSLWQSASEPVSLTAQDRQPWRPHVTVQNKVDPAQARALHTRLTQDFVPFSGMATGAALWRYLGGPWQHERDFPFSGPTLGHEESR